MKLLVDMQTLSTPDETLKPIKRLKQPTETNLGTTSVVTYVNRSTKWRWWSDADYVLRCHSRDNY